MKVKWSAVEAFEDFGHGVKFFHRYLSGTDSSFPDDELTVAFLDGYDWLHVGKKATVLHLKPNNSLFEQFSNPVELIYEVKIGILTFLLDLAHFMKQEGSGPFVLKITDKVSARLNA